MSFLAGLPCRSKDNFSLVLADDDHAQPAARAPAEKPPVTVYTPCCGADMPPKEQVIATESHNLLLRHIFRAYTGITGERCCDEKALAQASADGGADEPAAAVSDVAAAAAAAAGPSSSGKRAREADGDEDAAAGERPTARART